MNEVPICYEVHGQVVYGIIDRLLLHEEKIEIIDYKSHRVADSGYAQLVEQYRPQMELYVEGIKKIWPQHEVIAQLLFTHTAKLLSVAV